MRTTPSPLRRLPAVAGCCLAIAMLPSLPAATAAVDPNAGIIPTGRMAPDFTAVTAAGKHVKLSDFRGKIVVLDFWATWCMPCQEAMPHLEKVAREYGSQNVVVYAVSTGDQRSTYERWVKSHPQYTFLTAHDPAPTPRACASRQLYGVAGIPEQFIINPQGRIEGEVGGFGGRDDHRTEALLARLGVKVPATVAALGEKQLKAGAGKTVAAAGTTAPMIGFGGAMRPAKVPFSTFGNLKAGDDVPDFTAVGPHGGAVRLSDLQGKTIVLAFWNPFHSPASYLDTIDRQYSRQGVAVFGLAEAATESEYTKWLAADQGATPFRTARDPVGKEFNSGISAVNFGVGMLPAVAVIRPDGKLVGGVIGMGSRIPGIVYTLLRRAGIKLDDADAAAAKASMAAKK